MPSPSLASASLSVSGGAIRSVCPYRPPLPTSSPRSLVASSMRAASGGLGWPGGGPRGGARAPGEHQPPPPPPPPDGQAGGRLPEPADDHLAGDGGVALQVVRQQVVQ